jgi:aldehyde dehydrogenase (NAD+)
MPPADVDALFQSQQAHAPVMRATSAAERRERLTRLREAVRTHRSALQEALHADLRKAPVEVDLTEL